MESIILSRTRGFHTAVPIRTYVRSADLSLVDAPMKFPASSLSTRIEGHPTLRFPIAVNRIGAQLPHLLSQEQYSIYENLKSFWSHPWQFRIMFFCRLTEEGTYTINESQDVISSRPLLYLISGSLLEANIRHLRKNIRNISFQQIRRPKLDLNDTLHDRRADLPKLKDNITETERLMTGSVTLYLKSHPYWGSSSCNSPAQVNAQVNPIENSNRLNEEEIKLEQFLIEAFQLFMSSLSVQDSRLSIAQSERASWLTMLAFIYVPLSFMMGVFGVNIQQINGTGLSIWGCFLPIALFIMISVLLWWVIIVVEARRTREKVGSEV